jgi:hypothetical protein
MTSPSNRHLREEFSKAWMRGEGMKLHRRFLLSVAEATGVEGEDLKWLPGGCFRQKVLA